MRLRRNALLRAVLLSESPESTPMVQMRSNRILNISLAELGQSYYLTSEEVPEGTFDTERIASSVLRNLERLAPSDFD